jgi:hypothetical protein
MITNTQPSTSLKKAVDQIRDQRDTFNGMPG